MGRDTRTLDMFEVPKPELPLRASDHRLQVCELVSRALRDARFLDRYEAAGRMSSIAGREFSKFMLDAWCAESREVLQAELGRLEQIRTEAGAQIRALRSVMGEQS